MTRSNKAVLMLLFALSAIPVLAQPDPEYPRICASDCPAVFSCRYLGGGFSECRRRCYVSGSFCQQWYVQCWIELNYQKWGLCGETGPFKNESSGGAPVTTFTDCIETDPLTGECLESPIIIDTAGDGVDLTDAAGGVAFDLNGDGRVEHLAWTHEGTDDAWLVLDRNHNGIIDDGRELFGDNTAQPDGKKRNGYAALALFDLDGNGLIDAADPVTNDLRLWRDANHDGRSDPSELSRLDEYGIVALELDYKQSGRRDAAGNYLRYRAKIRSTKQATVDRWSYDVFLRILR